METWASAERFLQHKKLQAVAQRESYTKHAGAHRPSGIWQIINMSVDSILSQSLAPVRN